MSTDSKTFTLRITAQDRDIFNAIKKGTKKVETRAATERYANIKAGDEVIFAFGGDRVSKTVKAVQIFKTVDLMLMKYSPKDINPNVKDKEELKAMFDSFTGYKEKIAEHGIIAMELA